MEIKGKWKEVSQSQWIIVCGEQEGQKNYCFCCCCDASCRALHQISRKNWFEFSARQQRVGERGYWLPPLRYFKIRLPISTVLRQILQIGVKWMQSRPTADALRYHLYLGARPFWLFLAKFRTKGVCYGIKWWVSFFTSWNQL